MSPQVPARGALEIPLGDSATAATGVPQLSEEDAAPLAAFLGGTPAQTAVEPIPNALCILLVGLQRQICQLLSLRGAEGASPCSLGRCSISFGQRAAISQSLQSRTKWLERSSASEPRLPLPHLLPWPVSHLFLAVCGREVFRGGLPCHSFSLPGCSIQVPLRLSGPFPNLRSLMLDNNPISFLPEMAFQGCPRLTALSLCHSSVANLWTTVAALRQVRAAGRAARGRDPRSLCLCAFVGSGARSHSTLLPALPLLLRRHISVCHVSARKTDFVSDCGPPLLTALPNCPARPCGFQTAPPARWRALGGRGGVPGYRGGEGGVEGG